MKTAWDKWASGIPAFDSKGSTDAKETLYLKVVCLGSVEEEAQSLIHEKKIMEMEKELPTLLNWRFGFGTWDELKEMQRKIRAPERKRVL